MPVNVVEDFQRNRLMRAGFTKSGVWRTTANRLVDRHPASTGYYWKSYDFAPDRERSNLLQFPLGPAFPDNDFEQFAFTHDGGEMIFSLPNGLQGYVTDGKGNRIDEGPIEVVRDLKETSGSPVVVNGISGMHCHQHGMIDFEDVIRDGVGLFGEARRKVHDLLYPEKSKMAKIIEGDKRRFLTAIENATGPFLQTSNNKPPSRSLPNRSGPLPAFTTAIWNWTMPRLN